MIAAPTYRASSITENLEIKGVLHTMDSRCAVLGRVALGNMIAAFCPQVSEGIMMTAMMITNNDEVMESGEDYDQPTISSLELDHEIAKIE